MGGTRSIGRARLLALLVVVLGLLAMHGLAGAHHAAASTTAHAAPAAHRVAAHDQHQAVTTAAAPEPAHPTLSAPTCQADCPGVPAVLCVAVLAAAAGAALLARRRARSLPHRPVLPLHVPAPAAAGRRPPEPDPVAELCVSRT